MSFFDKLQEIEALDPKDKLSFWQKIKAELEHKLSKLEAKTYSVSEWVNASEKDIVMAYNDLYKSFKDKDVKSIKDQLTNMGDIKGVVLQIPIKQGNTQASFAAISNSIFGEESEITKLISQEKLGIPESVYTNLLGFEDDEVDIGEKEEKFNFWEKLSGKDKEKIENDLELAKKEVLALQTEVPYYIDSFCDWLESGLDPYNDYDTSDEANEKRLKSYQDPDYMINVAEQDFKETISTFSERVFGISQNYSEFLQHVENNDVSNIIDTLEIIKSESYSKKLTQWIFEELDITSLTELALDKFKDNQIRSKLLEQVSIGTNLSEPISFEDKDRVSNLFDELFNETIQKEDPMPVSTLFTIMNNESFWGNFGDDRQEVLLNLLTKSDDKTGKSYFDIVDGLENKELKIQLFESFNSALGFAGMIDSSINHDSIPKLYIDLKDAVNDKDFKALNELINDTKKLNVKDELTAFYYLLNNEKSLPVTILSEFNNKQGSAAFNTMIHSGYDIFLDSDRDEFKSEILLNSMLNIDMNTDNLNSLSDLDSLKILLQCINEEKGSDFIKDLILSNNVIPTCFEKYDQDQRNEFLSIIFNVFNNNIEKSNILSKSSLQVEDNEIKKSIQDVANLYSGYYLNLNDRLTINPNNLGNIWHANENLMNASKQSSFNQKIGEEDMPVEVAAEYLSALYKNDDFIVFGTDEITNKNHIKYAWFVDKDGETAIHFMLGNNKTSTSMDVEDAENTIRDLLKFDSYIYIGGYAINLDNIGYMCIDENSNTLNILDNTDEIETIEISDSEKKHLIKKVNENHQFFMNKEETQIVNVDKLDLLIEDFDTGEVSFVIEGNYFGSKFSETDEEGNEKPYIDGFMNKSFNNLTEEFLCKETVQIGDKHISLDNLSYSKYDEEKDTLELIVSSEKILIHIENLDEVKEIYSVLESYDFVTNELQAIKIEETANAWFTKSDLGDFVAFLMPNKKDETEQVIYMDVDNIEDISKKIIAVGQKDGFFIANNELINLNKITSIAVDKGINIFGETINVKLTAGSSKGDIAMSFDDYQGLLKEIKDLGSIKQGNQHEKISDLKEVLASKSIYAINASINIDKASLIEELRKNNKADEDNSIKLMLDRLRQNNTSNEFSSYKQDLTKPSNDNNVKPTNLINSSIMGDLGKVHEEKQPIKNNKKSPKM